MLGSASVLGCFSLFVEFDDSRIPQPTADATTDTALAVDSAAPDTLVVDSAPLDAASETMLDTALDTLDEADALEGDSIASDAELDTADAD